MQDFEQFFQECLSLALTEKQKEFMMKIKYGIYDDYFYQGISPEEAMEKEWG